MGFGPYFLASLVFTISADGVLRVPRQHRASCPARRHFLPSRRRGHASRSRLFLQERSSWSGGKPALHCGRPRRLLSARV